MRFWRLVCLAFAGLRRTPLRTTLTTLGVTIASAALVAMVSFAIGLQYQVETPFRVLALLNNIQVTPHAEETARDAPVLNDAALKRMTEIPGVAAAYPDIRAQAIKMRVGENTETAPALGLPAEASLFNIEQDIIIAGRFFAPDALDEAVIGTELLKGLGFKSPQDAIGKSVTLEATGLTPAAGSTFAFERKDFIVTIVGVYQAPPLLPMAARRAIILPVETMKQVPGIRVEAALKQLIGGGDASSIGYATATVRVTDPRQLDRVVEEIEGMGFQTRTVVSRLQGMRTFFIFLQVLLAAVGTVALVVAALGIANTLLMSVLERYQEIGVYKAIGASDGDLMVLFLTEAASFGLGGGLLGIALGWCVSWLLGLAIAAYAKSQGVGERLDLFVFPPWLLLATVGFSVVVAVLAGVYPAMRAARVDPIRALRRD